MIRDARAGVWIEIALFALASVLLYQMGLGVFLFLVPIQIVGTRRGSRALILGASASGAAIVAIRLIGAVARGLLESGSGVMVVELFSVAILMGGLVAVRVLEGRLPRSLARLLIATSGAAAASALLILYLRSRTEMSISLERVFSEALSGVVGLLSQGAEVAGGASEEAQNLVSRIVRLAADVFYRSFMLYYFVILTFSWWAGTKAAARSTPGVRPPPRLVGFFLPEVAIWPLIVSLAMVLGDAVFGLGVLGYVGWNAALVVLLLYGLQGLGIVHFVFARYTVPRLLRFLAYAIMVVLSVSPGANLVVMIGLPALGVSEIWLRYRTRRRKKDADEDNP